MLYIKRLDVVELYTQRFDIAWELLPFTLRHYRIVIVLNPNILFITCEIV